MLAAREQTKRERETKRQQAAPLDPPPPRLLITAQGWSHHRKTKREEKVASKRRREVWSGLTRWRSLACEACDEPPGVQRRSPIMRFHLRRPPAAALAPAVSLRDGGGTTELELDAREEDGAAVSRARGGGAPDPPGNAAETDERE